MVMLGIYGSGSLKGRTDTQERRKPGPSQHGNWGRTYRKIHGISMGKPA